MKKMTALALSMVLALTPVSAMAEAAEAATEEAAQEVTEEASDELVELNWSDFEEITKEVEGDYVTFDEVNVKMWMPSIFNETELTEDDRENGYIGYYTTDDESCAVAFVYIEAGITLDEYYEMLSEAEEVENAELMYVNDLYCLSYDIPGTDTTVLAFATEDGYILEVSFAPISDEGFASTAAFIGASIQAGDAEEEAEAETAVEAEAEAATEAEAEAETTA